MEYLIQYCDGYSSSYLGPFASESEARACFDCAPIMPGQTAYLLCGEEEIDRAYGPEDDRFGAID